METTTMNYCVTCQKDYRNAKIIECPHCKGEIREVKAARLVELMRELSETLTKMTPQFIKPNPKELVEIAGTIQKGEKRLLKEYKYRVAAFAELNYQLSVIVGFAEKMGYNLGQEPTPEPETQTEQKVESV